MIEIYQCVLPFISKYRYMQDKNAHFLNKKGSTVHGSTVKNSTSNLFFLVFLTIYHFFHNCLPGLHSFSGLQLFHHPLPSYLPSPVLRFYNASPVPRFCFFSVLSPFPCYCKQHTGNSILVLQHQQTDYFIMAKNQSA